MKWGIYFIISVFICTQISYSQSTAGSKTLYESRYIVDMPTAGVLTKSSYAFYSSVFSNGGISLQFDVSPFTNFNIGLSFSGTNIVGSGQIQWQNIPGIHLKYRILDEGESFPAISFGVNTQGKGEYSYHNKRYISLSPGFYLALSKNFEWYLGTVAFHSGICYSMDTKPEDRVPDLYLGFEHSIGSFVSINGEYDFNFNETDITYMKNKGMLNLALRWSLAKGVTIEMQFRDLLENVNDYNGYNRVIYLEYIKSF